MVDNTPTGFAPLQTGENIIFPDTPGEWRVIWTEAELLARNPRLTGWFRAEKVYNGAGPIHLQANFRVIDALVPDYPGDPFPMPVVLRLPTAAKVGE